MTSIELRPMVAEDADLMLSWRNDPFIVARSSSQRAVTRTEHVRWMESVTGGPSHLSFILVIGQRPVGHLRFDRDDSRRAVVTIYLIEEYTGRGLGVATLRRGVPLAFARWPDVEVIEALVRTGNDAGRKAFEKAGFKSGGQTADNHERFVKDRRPDGSPDLWRSDTEQNSAFYTAACEKFGVDVRALNWGSRRSQVRRFEVLAGVGPIWSDRILDVGCGQGDLFGWLCEKGFGGSYIGIDISPAMVAAAKGRFPDNEFLTLDLLEASCSAPLSCDWAFASGIFYLRRHAPMAYLEAMVRKMFALASKGLAFNSLSAWSTKQDEGEFFADPIQVLSLCHAITPYVALRHDYHPGDFTIYMLREAAGP